MNYFLGSRNGFLKNFVLEALDNLYDAVFGCIKQTVNNTLRLFYKLRFYYKEIIRSVYVETNLRILESALLGCVFKEYISSTLDAYLGILLSSSYNYEMEYAYYKA